MRILLIIFLAGLFNSCTCDELKQLPCLSSGYAPPHYLGCNQPDLEGDDLRKCATIALLTDLYSNVKYPPEAREKNIQGSVVTAIVVDSDGNVLNIFNKSGIGYGCDEECLRVVRLISEETGWYPGTMDCIPQRDTFILPVKFKLQ